MQTATLTMMEVPSMPRTDNREALEGLFRRLCRDFGEASGMAIIHTIVSEIGGLRVSIPDQQDLDRIERNRRICTRFTGDNIPELCILFNMSESNIRRVIDEERIRLRRDAEERTM